MSSQNLTKIRSLVASPVLRLSRYFNKQPRNRLKAMEDVKTIKDLGYAFNSDGQLRKIEENGEPGDEPFQFNVSDQHQECQAHYEQLGAAVTHYIYHLLETQENLVRLPVPKDAKAETGTFIFVSPEYDKKDKLMILIHGSGVVRAGQWARSLIINESLATGSQIPYIKHAIANNFGVMILNTNDNYSTNGKKITKSGSPEEHARYVWDAYVAKTKATFVAIVAHSYGGVVTLSLVDQLKDDFKRRVKAIAFTDSVHSYSNIKITDYMKQVSRNWISNPAPLDTPMKTPEYDIARVSAGHPKHEMTSCTCIESVFKFLDEKLSEN